MGEAIPTIENTIETESKNASIFRERRFLMRGLPEPLTTASEHIQIWDNYITNTHLRLRKMRLPKTNKYVVELTKKYPLKAGDLSRHSVTTINLSAYEYAALSVFEANEIRKNRYFYEYEGREYIIDIFIGPLFGLILAKVRFETDEEMQAFTPPYFAVIEVTQGEHFTGGKLHGTTADELRNAIEG